MLRLSQSRRALAPLAFTVGAFASLFDGLKLLVSNWRLAIVQVLPAMWIWLAMVDLKAHVLHGKSFIILRGPILILVVAVIVALTAASFFLNVVFAFAYCNDRATRNPPGRVPGLVSPGSCPCLGYRHRRGPGTIDRRR